MSVTLTALEIVNRVQRRLGVDTTAGFDNTNHARVLLDLLNEVVAEINDYAPWDQDYFEVSVTASTSIDEYTIIASGNREIHSIIEIALSSQASPLENRSTVDIRRLQRVKTGVGTPRQYSIVGTNASGHPKFRISPPPSSLHNNKRFNCAVQLKPVEVTVTATATAPPYPGKLVIQGLYAAALLEEAGGEPTPQYQVQYALYQKFLKETHNRLVNDTETVIYFTPRGFR